MFENTDHSKSAANFMKAMGNSYRLNIVTQLLNGEKNVSELNQNVKVSQPALSQHLSRLKKVGVLDCRREQRQIFYFIANPHIIRMLGVVAGACKAQ